MELACLENHHASVLSSLTNVGPAKAVGYLPLQTLGRFLGLDVEAVSANARSRGLAVLVLSPEECCIKSGALYVYDPDALDKILCTSRSVLALSNFPTVPEAFVRAIARDWLESDHPAMPIIKAAFAYVA